MFLNKYFLSNYNVKTKWKKYSITLNTLLSYLQFHQTPKLRCYSINAKNKIAHSTKTTIKKKTLSVGSSRTMNRHNRRFLQPSNTKQNDQQHASRCIASSQEMNSSNYSFQVVTHKATEHLHCR